jgi:hypothetical protein
MYLDTNYLLPEFILLKLWKQYPWRVMGAMSMYHAKSDMGYLCLIQEEA